jgi:hypothetical protein
MWNETGPELRKNTIRRVSSYWNRENPRRASASPGTLFIVRSTFPRAARGRSVARSHHVRVERVRCVGTCFRINEIEKPVHFSCAGEKMKRQKKKRRFGRRKGRGLQR